MRGFKLVPPVLAATLLAACAYGGYDGAYVGGGPAPVGYDGFYDDYYGPFYDGYWGGDGFFYYSDRRGHFHRDEGRHFRRDTAHGFHAVHGRGHAPPPARPMRDHP